MVVLLRIGPREGLLREEGTDRIGGLGLGFQQQVADTYELLAAGDPDRFQTVDATGSVEVVVGEVVDAMRVRWRF
jgi:thymidylate kinase